MIGAFPVVSLDLVKDAESWIPPEPVASISAFYDPNRRCTSHWCSKALVFLVPQWWLFSRSFLSDPTLPGCFTWLTYSHLSLIASYKFPPILVLNILFLTFRSCQPLQLDCNCLSKDLICLLSYTWMGDKCLWIKYIGSILSGLKFIKVFSHFKNI